MKISDLITHAQELLSLYGDLEVYAQDESDGAYECDEEILHFKNDIQNCIESGYKQDEYNGPFPFKGFYIGSPYW